MRRAAGALLLAAGGLLAACDGPGEKATPKTKSAPTPPRTGASGPPPERSPEKPGEPGLRHVPDQAYRVAVAVADPEELSAEDLARALASRWDGVVKASPLALPGALVAKLLGAQDAPSLTDEERNAAGAWEQVLLAGRGEGGRLRVREWLPALNELSAPWQGRDAGGGGNEARRGALEGLAFVFSWSGRVTEVAERRLVVRLVGSGLLAGRAPPVAAGDLGQLDYHVPGEGEVYQSVKGSVGRVLRVEPAGAGLALEVENVGWYSPKPGDRWRRLYLPGGQRRLVVLSNADEPQSGFVVYAAPRKYSRTHDDFAGTTDAAGAVSLDAGPGEVRYVQVVSTVEGVEFVFFQGVVPVASGMPAWEVRVADMSALRGQAAEIATRLLSSEQMDTLRRQIQTLLDTSALQVANSQFPQAIENLEQAGKLLSGVQNSDAGRLRETVARLKKRYEENLERQKLLDSRTAVLKALAQADEEIYSGRFAEGAKLLQQALERWPAKLFPERAQTIQAKLAQARRLVAEEQADVGQARGELLRAVHKLGQDRLALAELKGLEPRIDLLREKGVHDLAHPYSDRELLGRLKLKLDRISQSLVAQIQRLKAQYEASQDVHERDRIYEQSERLAKSRETIDALLVKLVERAAK